MLKSKVIKREKGGARLLVWASLPIFKQFLVQCKLKVMTLIFLAGMWFFFTPTMLQSGVDSATNAPTILISEAVKLGFSVLFLTIAVIFLFMVWKEERKENKNLTDAIVDRTDDHNARIEASQKMVIEAIHENTATMKELIETLNHNEQKRNETEIKNSALLNQIKDKL